MINNFLRSRVPFGQKKISLLILIFIIIGFLGGAWLYYKLFLKREPGQISAEAWSYIQQEKIKAQRNFAEFVKTPAGQIWLQHPYWPPEICQKIAQGEILPGMNKDQVRKSLANRLQTKIKININNEREEWIVDGENKLVLHFLNGVLQSWEGK
ncbi:MAG: hypothetical protein ACPL5I_12090 [Thermodesulfobacteriota bacterium]